MGVFGLVVPPDTGSSAGDLTAFLTAVRSSIEASGRRTVLSLLDRRQARRDRRPDRPALLRLRSNGDEA